MKKTLGLIAVSMLLATSALAETPPADTASGGLTMNMKGVSLNFGGFIEAAGVYRDKNLNSDLASPFQKLPTPNQAANYQGETRFSARQSRLNILAKGDYDPTTHLAGYYEMDFLGAAPTANSNESNSYNPRIRHLYTTADWDSLGLHILAGQTWSLVTMNNKGITPRNEVTPLGIEAQYVPGFSWTRQPQIRIVKDWDKKYWLALSAEAPQTSGISTGPNNTIANNFAVNQTSSGNFAGAANLSVNTIPDFVVKAAYEPGWGHFEVFDLIRSFQTSLQSGSTVANYQTVTNAIGGGAILPIIPNQLTLQLSGMYGKGIGRYGSGQLADATLNSVNELVPLTESQLLAGLVWDPTKELNFYGYYGQERVQKDDLTAGGKGYGYGVSSYDNSGFASFGAAGKTQGQIKSINQATVGTWWKFYQGSFGKMQAGLQYSYTTDKYFEGVGGAPTVSDNIVFTSLRYYWN